MDSYEEMIVPEVPKALPNEQLFIYVPTASNENLGVAKFDNEHFSVDVDGTVHLRSIGRCGRISILRDQWTDGSPTKALIEVPGVDVGSVIIMLPADDDTRLIANRARLSAYPVAFTPLDGVSSVTILRSDAEMTPDGDMTFVYLVLKTSIGGNPIAAIIGVDAYGETEEPTSVDLSGFAPNENGKGSIVETYADRTVVTELTYDDTGRIIKIGDTTLEWGEEE